MVVDKDLNPVHFIVGTRKPKALKGDPGCAEHLVQFEACAWPCIFHGKPIYPTGLHPDLFLSLPNHVLSPKPLFGLASES